MSGRGDEEEVDRRGDEEDQTTKEEEKRRQREEEAGVMGKLLAKYMLKSDGKGLAKYCSLDTHNQFNAVFVAFAGMLACAHVHKRSRGEKKAVMVVPVDGEFENQHRWNGHFYFYQGDENVYTSMEAVSDRDNAKYFAIRFQEGSGSRFWMKRSPSKIAVSVVVGSRDQFDDDENEEEHVNVDDLVKKAM